MVEPMLRKKTPEEARKLRERGLFDVGASSFALSGFEKRLRFRLWEDDDPNP